MCQKIGTFAVMHTFCIFQFVGAVAFSNAYFGEHPIPAISNVLCYGNESKLLDCSYTNLSSCSPTYTAGVRCQGDTIPGLL